MDHVWDFSSIWDGSFVRCQNDDVPSLPSKITYCRSDIFSTALPLVVTGSFAAGYVLSLSAANLGGRVLWASLSDFIGRKKVFVTFFTLAIPLFLSTPYLISWVCIVHASFIHPSPKVSANPSVLPLALFYGSTMVIISIFGAGEKLD